MKFLAILQIVCILFLSSYTGKVMARVQPVKLDCCKKQTKTCERVPEKKDDCSNGNCSMLLTCGICGFLAIEPLTVKPASFISIDQPVQLYKIGNAAGYLPADWKPPQV
jgi:hypothetical protein